MLNKLKPYVPINDNNCIVSKDQDHEYANRFQGKPVNKFPLKNSNIEKLKEKIKIKKILFFAKEPEIKIAKPKKIDKNKGISTSAKGIKPLNISS